MNRDKRVTSVANPLLALLLVSSCGSADEPVVTPAVKQTDPPVSSTAPGSFPDKAPSYMPPTDADLKPAPVLVLLGHETPVLASGTEPYWTAEIDGSWVTFKRPGLALVEVPMPELKPASENRLSFSSEGLDVVLDAAGCDRPQSGLGVTLTFEGIEYSGCAGKPDPDELDGQSISWKPLIRSSLAAIDACLSETDGPRHIRALYPRESGTIGMILMDEAGRFEECGADIETAGVVFLDPVMPEQAKDWLAGPAVFSRTDYALSCANSDGSDEVIEGAGVYHPKGC